MGTIELRNRFKGLLDVPALTEEALARIDTVVSLGEIVALQDAAAQVKLAPELAGSRPGALAAAQLPPGAPGAYARGQHDRLRVDGAVELIGRTLGHQLAHILLQDVRGFGNRLAHRG